MKWTQHPAKKESCPLVDGDPRVTLERMEPVELTPEQKEQYKRMQEWLKKPLVIHPKGESL